MKTSCIRCSARRFSFQNMASTVSAPIGSPVAAALTSALSSTLACAAISGQWAATTLKRGLRATTVSVLLAAALVGCSTGSAPAAQSATQVTTPSPSPSAEVATATHSPSPVTATPGTTPVPSATPTPVVATPTPSATPAPATPAPTAIPAALTDVVADIESLVERGLLTREVADIHICLLSKRRDCLPPEREIDIGGQPVHDQIIAPEPVTLTALPTVLGVVRHDYATATTSSRRIVELDDGSIHTVWWVGEHIVGRSAPDGRTFGPAIRISHIGAATGASMAATGGRVYVVYADSHGKCAFLRTGSDLLQLDEPRSVYCSDTAFTVQWPAINIAPSGKMWIVFRSGAVTIDGQTRFTVYVIRSGREPMAISTAEQEATSGAGTTGAVFFPGGRALVLHTGSALYASTLDDQHQIVAENYVGDGTHGFSGVVIGERLWVAYTTMDVGVEMRAFTWAEGWSEPTVLPQAERRSLGLIDIGGEPVIIGHDGASLWWYSDGIVHAGMKLTLLSSLMYLATPERSTGITIMWQDGVRPGTVDVGEIFFLRAPH